MCRIINNHFNYVLGISLISLYFIAANKKKKKMQDQLKELAVALYDIGAIKFGEFITKVGLKTPIYFDLRIMIAYPQIMVTLEK